MIIEYDFDLDLLQEAEECGEDIIDLININFYENEKVQ